LSQLVAAIKKVDPERNTFIDLYPNYADAESQLFANDYQDYVDRYIAEVKPHYVCYDHYHFRKNGIARAGYFANFEIIRKAALASDLDYMTISQLVTHGGYCDATFSQLLWEANMALCYGAKRISYFTFMLVAEDGEWKNACVDLQGNKMPHFDDVKAVISRVYNLGVELFNKRSEAVFHLTGDPASLEEGCAAYESYGKLGKVTGNEFVIGFFSDGSFMIMNKHWEEGAEGKNALIFDDVASGLEYFDVESASWKAYNNKNESGKYVFNAEAGEGLLFRVK
ncbi:MAG: hypothetical protein II808_04425, partial [Clostridia bacterium]|nr:hypothetical protein [Clostridia bacterium]